MLLQDLCGDLDIGVLLLEDLLDGANLKDPLHLIIAWSKSYDQCLNARQSVSRRLTEKDGTQTDRQRLTHSQEF